MLENMAYLTHLGRNSFTSMDVKLRSCNRCSSKQEQLLLKMPPIFKFAVQVPHHEHEARAFEAKQGHTKQTTAETTEQECLHDYSAFKDCGKGGEAPAGYKKIRVCYVCDFKHDLRHRARLVAGGNLTECDLMASYAGVVSLRSMRLAILIGEMNGLVHKAGDTGSDCLEAKTKEKVCFIAGKGFGSLEGHTLIIIKALYGLQTSGARFHEQLADVLRNEGFKPTLADADLWIRDAGDVCECVCVCVLMM